MDHHYFLSLYFLFPVAPRVLSVGDHGRAERIASLFDPGTHRVVTSTRSFVTHSGTFNHIPVSVIATGMGAPMIDFVVRETRAIVEGPMVMLRYGTCGGLQDTPEGTVVIPSQGSILIRRDPDNVGIAIQNQTFTSSSTGDNSLMSPKVPFVGRNATPTCPYSVSHTVLPHQGLSTLLYERMKQYIDQRPSTVLSSSSSSSDKNNTVSKFTVMTGMDATADSFYSSQGRTNNSFYDKNESLLDRIETGEPLLRSLQMETFHLFDLARASRKDLQRNIAASAAAIVIVNRNSGKVIAKQDVEMLELEGGRACLETLTRFDLATA